MDYLSGKIVLSASDISGYITCRHLSRLDLEVAKGRLAKPGFWDPLVEMLRERGRRHEQGFVDHLRKLVHCCQHIHPLHVREVKPLHVPV